MTTTTEPNSRRYVLQRAFKPEPLPPWSLLATQWRKHGRLACELLSVATAAATAGYWVTAWSVARASEGHRFSTANAARQLTPAAPRRRVIAALFADEQSARRQGTASPDLTAVHARQAQAAKLVAGLGEMPAPRKLQAAAKPRPTPPLPAASLTSQSDPRQAQHGDPPEATSDADEFSDLMSWLTRTAQSDTRPQPMAAHWQPMHAAVALPPRLRVAKPVPSSAPRLPHAEIAALVVHGSLPSSVVRRAFERARPEFAACYARAARSLPGPAHSQLELSMIIDETGRARDPKVAATLPGIEACAISVVSKLVTRAPDTGVVRAALRLVFDFETDARAPG
jgi:hypothetical protein